MQMDGFLTLKGGNVELVGAPETIFVLPIGHVVSSKGEFDVDDESYKAMKAQIAKRGVDLVVDYEHQTLKGCEAPAAGWVKELKLEDGQIKAVVEWTPRGARYLENKEYRYLSPVVNVRKADNKAIGLHSLALTNTPAIEGMNPIVNSDNFEGGQHSMDIKKLAELLGLSEEIGMIDVSFSRDDFAEKGLHPQVKPTAIPFDVEGRHLILIDDVLYTGRTTRAAINELFDYGRPASIALAVLADRGGRELPVAATWNTWDVALAEGQSLVLERKDNGELAWRLENA